MTKVFYNKEQGEFLTDKQVQSKWAKGKIASGIVIEVTVTAEQAEVIVDINSKFDSNERKFEMRQEKELSLDRFNDESGWEPTDSRPTPDEVLVEQDEQAEIAVQKRHLMEVVALLKPKQQEIIRLHFFENKSLRQIAAIFGTDHRNIGEQLEVIKKKIKKLF